MTLPKHPPASLLFTLGSPAEIRQLVSQSEFVSNKRSEFPSQKLEKGSAALPISGFRLSAVGFCPFTITSAYSAFILHPSCLILRPLLLRASACDF